MKIQTAPAPHQPDFPHLEGGTALPPSAKSHGVDNQITPEPKWGVFNDDSETLHEMTPIERLNMASDKAALAIHEATSGFVTTSEEKEAARNAVAEWGDALHESISEQPDLIGSGSSNRNHLLKTFAASSTVDSLHGLLATTEYINQTNASATDKLLEQKNATTRRAGKLAMYGMAIAAGFAANKGFDALGDYLIEAVPLINQIGNYIGPFIVAGGYGAAQKSIEAVSEMPFANARKRLEQAPDQKTIDSAHEENEDIAIYQQRIRQTYRDITRGEPILEQARGTVQSVLDDAPLNDQTIGEIVDKVVRSVEERFGIAETDKSKRATDAAAFAVKEFAAAAVSGG